MNAPRIRAVILDGKPDAEALAAIRAAIESPEMTVVFARPTISDIVARVSRETGISAHAITSPRQNPLLVECRFAAVWVADQLGRHTDAEIGRGLGDRDRCTVVHARARATAIRESDPDFRSLTARILAHFTGEQP